ncbi:unnamed protein product, partial [marine sediment metagenome]
YYSNKDNFLFGSEVKSLLYSGKIAPKINWEKAFKEFFSNSHFQKRGDTLIKGIEELLPGHYAVVKPDRQKTIKRYWDLPESKLKSVANKKIAKTCRISRDQAEYRLKKLESSGILKKFATIFNYSALGFKEFIIVWLRLDCTKEQKLQLREELRKNKNILTYFDVLGDYDLGFDCIYKDKHEFQREFGEFMNKHKNIIKSYSTFITTSFNFFPLKEFDIKQTEKEFSLGNLNEKAKLDEKDIKILRELDKNGRVKIIDIAKSINISAEMALYKLKNLYKNKIVLGSRIIFDMEKMNYFFGNLKLNLKHLNEKTKQEIFHYCKQHKFINALSFGMFY